MGEHSFTDFTIRLRFRIPSEDRIGIDESEIVIESTAGQAVTLKSDDVKHPIRESGWIIMLSKGWDSEEAARDATESLTDALRRSLARTRPRCGLRGPYTAVALLQVWT